MPGNAGLKLTVFADDKASGPLRAIGMEAKRMGEGFQKSAGALRLVEGAAGQMGGKVAEAAGKISGLAGLIGSSGPFGLALAGITIAISAASAVWKVFQTETENSQNAVHSMTASMLKMNEGVQKQKDELAKLTEQVRFYGMEAGQVQAFQAEDRLELIDKEIGANAKLINALIQRRHTTEGLGAEDEAQLQALFKNNDAMKVVAETLRGTIDQLDEKARLEFIDSENTHAATEAARAKTRAMRDEKDATKALLDDLQKLIDADEKQRKERLKANSAAAERGVKSAVSEYERKIDLDQKYAEHIAEQSDERKQMFADVASASVEAAASIGDAAMSGSSREQSAARTAAVATIGAALASAAAKAISSTAAIPPPFGQILGVAAAAAITMAIKGMTAQYGFARGGYTGDGPRNEVAGVVHKGEFVVPAGPVAQAMRRGGSGGVTVINNFNSVAPPNSLDTKRAVREIERHAKKIRSRMGAVG